MGARLHRAEKARGGHVACGALAPPTHCQDTQGLSLNKVIAQTPAVLFSFPLFSLLADLFVDCLL